MDESRCDFVELNATNGCSKMWDARFCSVLPCHTLIGLSVALKQPARKLDLSWFDVL